MVCTYCMPEGYISLKSAVYQGQHITALQAKQYGLIECAAQPAWQLPPDEIGIGYNTFTDAGRKYLARAFGGCTPVSDYICTYFGIGNSDTPVTVDDTTLASPITLSNGDTKKLVDSITYTDFTAAIQFTIGASDGNGNLIRETGLFAGDGTLLARKIGYNINKTSSFAPVLIWRIRF